MNKKNDNGYANPTFYDVPEFKETGVIYPKYTYELKIDGYEKTVKFLRKPDDDKIIDALDYLTLRLKLYDDEIKGLWFDDDNSPMAQLTRDENYFEYSSWDNSDTNFEKGELIFRKDCNRGARRIYNNYLKTNNITEDWSDVGYDKVKTIEKELRLLPKYFRVINFSLIKIANKKPVEMIKSKKHSLSL